MHRKITMNYKDKVANYGYVNMQKSAGRQFSLTSAQPSVHITVYACHWHNRCQNITKDVTKLQGAAKKSKPLSYFVNISTTNRNFCKKIYTTIYWTANSKQCPQNWFVLISLLIYHLQIWQHTNTYQDVHKDKTKWQIAGVCYIVQRKYIHTYIA